jgi:hypothetical protein
VTTGCICPSCGGLTPQRAEPCRGCEIAAMPPGVGKALSTLAYRAMYGGEPGPGVVVSFGVASTRAPEAGS